MKALIVDDDMVSRSLLEYHLEGLGECQMAANGVQGLRQFINAHEQGSRFDLVCLDIMMPGMTGQETLRAIREWEETRGITGLDGVKIIMTTAADDAENIMGAFRQQCEAYLIKPIERPELDRQLALLGFA